MTHRAGLLAGNDGFLESACLSLTRWPPPQTCRLESRRGWPEACTVNLRAGAGITSHFSASVGPPVHVGLASACGGGFSTPAAAFIRVSPAGLKSRAG